MIALVWLAAGCAGPDADGRSRPGPSPGTDPPTDPPTGPGTPTGPGSWRVDADDVEYLGSFDVPTTGPDGGDLAYGGHALGWHAANGSLFFGGHDWYQELAEVEVVEPGGVATVLQDPQDVLDGRMGQIDDSTVKLGGALVWEDRLIVTAYSYYDADGTQQRSHFASGVDLATAADAAGPFDVSGAANSRSKAGYMGAIPEEWRAAFGGPALTGNCCLSILGASSAGPAATVFDPADVGVTDPVPGTTVLFYEAGNPATDLGTETNDVFVQSDVVAGIAFPPGSSSVLFVGTHGRGEYCYGPGTDDESLHGTPDGEGNVWCYDPVYSSKGTHAYPYEHQVWAYAAEDLVAVAEGTLEPWEPVPSATFELAGITDDGGATIAGAAYDPEGGRLFVTERYGEEPRVHIFAITGPATGAGP